MLHGYEITRKNVCMYVCMLNTHPNADGNCNIFVRVRHFF